MRWKAASAPRRRSSRPASSAVICAASCCSASRFWRKLSSCACCAFKPLSAWLCSGSRRAASSRFSAMAWRLVSRASLLRAACACHSCKRRSMRCASASICFSAAPSLAASLSPVRRSSPRASSCAVSSSMARLSASASLCALSRSASSLPSRPSVSRSSRFSASGPSLAGLPPVTVELWKHSPSGVRK